MKNDVKPSRRPDRKHKVRRGFGNGCRERHCRLVMKPHAGFLELHGFSLTAIQKLTLAIISRKACGYGPGAFFGQHLLAEKVVEAIGLIPCAVGGTSINEWSGDSMLFTQMVIATEQ